MHSQGTQLTADARNFARHGAGGGRCRHPVGEAGDRAAHLDLKTESVDPGAKQTCEHERPSPGCCSLWAQPLSRRLPCSDCPTAVHGRVMGGVPMAQAQLNRAVFKDYYICTILLLRWLFAGSGRGRPLKVGYWEIIGYYFRFPVGCMRAY